MRPNIRAFIELCVDELPCPEPIVEIGSKVVPGQENIGDLRPLFWGRQYIGCDIERGPGVDRVEDVHNLKFGDGEVGTFLLADTLEHVQDPLRAAQELRRCLNHEKGVVIATSVMHFPIHAFPNDYWRFTPEGFRSLGDGFDFAATLYAGDPGFPHSVCLVAGFGGELAARAQGLAERAARLGIHAPPQFDRVSGCLIQHLAQRLVVGHKDPPAPSQPLAGALEGVFQHRGWVLIPGTWVQGWTSCTDATSVEIRVEGVPVHRTKPEIARPDIDCSLGLAPDTAHGFREQVQFMSDRELTGRAELWAINAGGDQAVVAVSAPGVVVPQPMIKSHFTLHSFDYTQNPSQQRGVGRSLVAAIQGRGERVRVDLGCGFRKQGNIGIDKTLEGTSADLVCQLGFEPIPLDDESIDEVTCRDFLEHLPKAVYLERTGSLHYPIIQLMNEIWRILKPGGTFISWTPCFPKDEAHQDPTHLSVWTQNSMDYFCGKYPIAKTYGVKTDFELIDSSLDDFYLYAKLRK